MSFTDSVWAVKLFDAAIERRLSRRILTDPLQGLDSLDSGKVVFVL
jgi:hypothetical protein